MSRRPRTLGSRLKSFFCLGSALDRAEGNAESRATLGNAVPQASAIPVIASQEVPITEETPLSSGSPANGEEQSEGALRPLQNDEFQAVITSLSPRPKSESERYSCIPNDSEASSPKVLPLAEPAVNRASENAESQTRVASVIVVDGPHAGAIPVPTPQHIEEESRLSSGSLAGGEKHPEGARRPLQNNKPKAVVTSPLPPDSEQYPCIPSDALSETPLSTSLAGSYNIFPGASNFHLEHLHVINAPSPGSNLDLASSEGWKLLLQHTAPNALYNSSARFDSPRCDEDTRIELLREIMAWIQDREGTTRLLCLTGAAGAGKSALQQTIAERCSSQGILASSFFFSASDPTRNNVLKLVPTIAYQISQKDIHFRRLLVNAVENDPLIFEKSLTTQFDTLVAGPWKALEAGLRGREDLQLFPQALLIDGLDECLDPQRQEELLVAIKDCFLSSSDLPFRIFLASRPEWAIRTALSPSGVLHSHIYHIRLSDDYNATADIHRMLWRRLTDIGRRSNDPRAHPDLWPTKEDIEKLVRAASGQFIYAATVVKYVGEPRSSPVDRLRTVLTWSPGQRGRPFAPLDLLYSNIVSGAKAAYEAVDTNEYDFLILLKIFDRDCEGGKMPDVTIDIVEEVLALPVNTYHGLFSDLRALIGQPDPQQPRIFKYYHRSFSEWLNHKDRSGPLFVPSLDADMFAVARILPCIRQYHRVAKDIPRTARCAAFLMCMAWVEPAGESPTHPAIDSFLDFASEDGTLRWFVESTLVYYTARARSSRGGTADPDDSYLVFMQTHCLNFMRFIQALLSSLLAETQESQLVKIRPLGLQDALINALNLFLMIMGNPRASEVRLFLDGLVLDHASSCRSRYQRGGSANLFNVGNVFSDEDTNNSGVSED